MFRLRFAVTAGFLFVASAAFAQSNDIAASFGGTFGPGAKGRQSVKLSRPVPLALWIVPLVRDFPLKAPMPIGWQTSE
jgi:hypothetical protein